MADLTIVEEGKGPHGPKEEQFSYHFDVTHAEKTLRVHFCIVDRTLAALQQRGCRPDWNRLRGFYHSYLEAHLEDLAGQADPKGHVHRIFDQKDLQDLLAAFHQKKGK